MKYDSNYYAVHRWLFYKYGKASCCKNPNCKKESSNFQWALKKDKKYEKNIDNFIQLCGKCHREYDGGVWNKGKINVYSKEHLKLLRELKVGIPLSDTHKINISKGKMGTRFKRKIIECPHCGKAGGTVQMKRWHFNNCKNKKP